MSPQNFANQWKQLRPILSRRFCRYLSCEELEEAMGDVLIYALKRLSSLPEEGEEGFKLLAWLTMLTKYKCLHRRDRERTRSVFVASWEDDIEAKGEDRGDYIALEETRALLSKLLRVAHLTEPQRETINCILNGDNLADHARSKSISRQGAGCHYNAALSKLRKAASSPDRFDDWTPEALFAYCSNVSRR